MDLVSYSMIQSLSIKKNVKQKQTKIFLPLGIGRGGISTESRCGRSNSG